MLTQIEAERIRHHLTREELIKQIGVSMKTYSDWVNERHEYRPVDWKGFVVAIILLAAGRTIILRMEQGQSKP